jgi:CelD/BcsL family acetyltransferase involved in cellulose biosynthesis
MQKFYRKGERMISFEPLDLTRVPWEELDRYEDRTLFQTRSWLDFVAETQGAEPVVAAIREDGQLLGYFTGLIVSKFGIKILGSPFKGWTTAYMGFNLQPGVSRIALLDELASFAFRQLGCHHLEVMDRNVAEQEVDNLSFEKQIYHTLQIDLTRSEQEIYTGMDNKSCRWCIRKAEKSGVVIEKATDAGFAADYYAQLQDVFAKQSLVPTYDLERVRTLITRLQPTGNLLLLRARSPEGVCIATGIFPAFNDTAFFWGGASWRKFQYLSPNEPIMWYAMRYWKARGIKKFDMAAGNYKKKYGGQAFQFPRLLKSKYRFLLTLRNAAQAIVQQRQQFIGFLKDKIRH